MCLVTSQHACFIELAGLSCHHSFSLLNIVIVKTSSIVVFIITSIRGKKIFLHLNIWVVWHQALACLRASKPLASVSALGHPHSLWSRPAVFIEPLPRAPVRIGLWGHRDNVPEAFPTSDQVKSLNLLVHISPAARKSYTLFPAPDFAPVPGRGRSLWCLLSLACQWARGSHQQDLAAHSP